MQRNDHAQLICTLLRRENYLWPEQLDQHGFINYAESQGVLPLLAIRADAIQWPHAVCQAVMIAQAATASIINQRLKVVSTLLQGFQKNHICSVLIKGAANAYLLYESPDLRPHGDVDIMIKPADYEMAVRVLKQQGFIVDDIQPGKFDPYQTTATLSQGQYPEVVVDLHWKINNRLLLADTLGFDELWSTATPIKQYGEFAVGTDAPRALLVSCIHNAGSLPIERNRLIGLYDAYLLIKKLGVTGTSAVLQNAADKGILTLCLDYMSDAISCFGREAEKLKFDQLVSPVADTTDEPSARLLTPAGSWLQDQLLDWQGVQGVRNRLEYIWHKLSRKLNSR